MREIMLAIWTTDGDPNTHRHPVQWTQAFQLNGAGYYLLIESLRRWCQLSRRVYPAYQQSHNNRLKTAKLDFHRSLAANITPLTARSNGISYALSPFSYFNMIGAVI